MEKLNLKKLPPRLGMKQMQVLIAMYKGIEEPVTRQTVYRYRNAGKIPLQIEDTNSATWDSKEAIKMLGLA